VRYTTANSTLPTRYTYTGQYSYLSDDATDLGGAGFGLMFYNARWYDPVLGRFAQADSIVPRGVQGLDRYAYVNNSPVRFIDPTGHFSEDELAKSLGFESVDKLHNSEIWKRWAKLGILGILTNKDFTWGSILSFKTDKGTVNLMAIQGNDNSLMFWDVDNKISYSLDTVFMFGRAGNIYTDQTGSISPSGAAGFKNKSKKEIGDYERIDCLGVNSCEEIPVPILQPGWYQGENESIGLKKTRDALQVTLGYVEMFSGAFAVGGAAAAILPGCALTACIGNAVIGLAGVVTVVDGSERVHNDSIIDVAPVYNCPWWVCE